MVNDGLETCSHNHTATSVLFQRQMTDAKQLTAIFLNELVSGFIVWPGFKIAPRTLGGTLNFCPAMKVEFLLLPVVRDESFRKFWLCPNLQVVTAPEIE